jgi:pSer/pThr/pTyr-binding forkhead associated (FHA) protein
LPVVDRLFAEDFKLNEWLDKQGVPTPIIGVSRQGDAAIKQAAYSSTHHTPLSTVEMPTPLTGAALVPLDNEAALRRLARDAHQPDLPPLVETQLSQTKVVTVGRQPGIYLLIDHASVSRRHAEISYANGQYILRDLGSTNGTYINGVRLEAESVSILKQNDEIRFGKVAKFSFQVRTIGVKDESTLQRKVQRPDATALHEMKTGFYDPRVATQAPPSALGQPVFNAAGSLLLPGATSALPAAEVAKLTETPTLIVVARGQPRAFPLKIGKRVMLGRDKQADIVLAEVLVSREHAEVVHGPDGFYIHDLGSSNGTLVNQVKIDNPYLLTHGDRIAIGNAMIFFMAPSSIAGNAEAAAQLTKDAAPSARLHHADRTSTCRNCGASNMPLARFCTTCGTPL